MIIRKPRRADKCRLLSHKISFYIRMRLNLGMCVLNLERGGRFEYQSWSHKVMVLLSFGQ